MTQHAIVRINTAGEPTGLWQFDALTNTCTDSRVTDWADQQMTAQSIILLLPASWVYQTTTQIASKNNELLAKSIPFAIEEELSNDVADNYYAFRSHDDGSQSVVAVEKSHLIHLNEQIKTAKLNVKAIFSETDWLPKSKHAIHWWQDGNSGLVRFGLDQAMRMDTEQVMTMIPVFGSEAQTLITNQHITLENKELVVAANLSAASCCLHLLESNPIDLYVDELQANKQTESKQSLRTVYALVVALVLSWVVIQGIQWFSLNNDIKELRAQQKALFSESFTDAAAVELIDPFAAMQSRLKIQNNNNNLQQNVLVDSLHAIGASLRQEQLLKVRGLRLVDSKLELQVTAPAMSTINSFHQLLQQQAYQFNVQIGVNELAEDNSFRSILTMVPR